MAKLLVVDDNEQNRYYLQALLMGNGHDVMLAANGAEALDMARITPPDLIITDILMPGMDGYTLCRQWKRDAALKEVPLVFYTGTYTDPKDEQLALDMGAVRFMLKPQEPDVLMAMVDEIISDHQAGRTQTAPAPMLEETVYFKEYNEALIRKLEDKLMELETAKASLESEVAIRRKAEEEAIQAGCEWQRTFDASNNAIWILDTDQKIVRANKTSERFFDYAIDDLIGKHCWEVVHGSSGPIPDCPVSRASVSMQRESQALQIGNTWYEITVDPIIDGNGRLLGSVHSVDDITRRKQTEEALLLHTRQVQALLDLQLLSHASEEQVLDFVLDACLEITGSQYSFIGAMNKAESVMTIHRWSKSVMPACALSEKPIEYPVCAAGLWGDCIRERKPVICNDYQAPHPGKKGLPEGHVPIHRFIAVPVFDGGQIVLVGAVANKASDYSEGDVNALSTLLHKKWEILSRQRQERERLLLEEQLHQAQKMEAIGQLAGGVAHDFNNILQAILGYGQMLQESIHEKSEAHEFSVEIVQAAERAATLTRQLLAFSRRQVLEMKDLNLNEVVENISKMIRRIIGENIQLHIVPDLHAGAIYADQGQMEQILLNLCVNARDAMPEGGVLTVEIENVVIDKDYCAIHTWATPGSYVLLTVTDNGCGMDAKTQERIFEPFFTTKEIGKGTGLGLATVYGIVRQHQGMIQVYSEENKGTAFRIYLPSFESIASTRPRTPLERPKGGSETILLAEDDEVLRKLATRILSSAGYTILLAANGQEALEVAKARYREIDLILLDIVMPKLSGKAVYDTLIQLHPHLRFLFSSGYSTTMAHTGFMLQEGIELLQKPYAPDALLRKVREVLDKKIAE